MDSDGSYQWNGRSLRTTKDAAYELMIASVEIDEVVMGLNNSINCPNIRRNRHKLDLCTKIQGKDFKVVIGDDVIRDFGCEPCWTIIHIKPYPWSNS